MNKAKPEGRDVPIEDPHRVEDSLRLLFEAEVEFLLKVEGTSTLPYTAQVQSLGDAEGRFLIKLARPLPHEMMGGAVFRMVFAVADQRYEGLTTFLNREGYLQYRFQCPTHLVHADRRHHKRYPFRPRENAYVIAQDSGIPGLGIAGPLVDISMGGFALRVDRVIKLDDGMRVPPRTALFERGKGFNRVRIQDLPRLRLLEARGVTAHASERGSEVILGMSFVGMTAEEETMLAEALAFREKMYRGGQPPRAGQGADGGPAAGSHPAAARGEGEPLLEADESDSALALPEVSMVLRLQRRTALVLVIMADQPRRATLLARLRSHGYHRLEVLEELSQVGPFCQRDPRRGLPQLLLADLALSRIGDAEPLAAVRLIERQLAVVGPRPMVILCEDVDPTLLLAQAPATRFLPYAAEAEEAWIATLDLLLE